MSRAICSNAIDGAVQWVARADSMLDLAIKAKEESHPVGFPDTAYFLPVIYSFTGKKATTLDGMRDILRTAKELLPERPSGKVWLPYLGGTLDAGVASLFACEIIEACKYVIGPNPVNGIWLGAASDVIMRERGIEFVDGSAPGFAAITGAAPTNQIAVKIARQLQEKNLYVFMGGSTNGKQFAEQLAEEGVQLGWETRLVPFGKDVSSLIYALGFANRAALSFGGVDPGDFRSNLGYSKNRIFAFVLALGEVTPEKYALAAGAINYGFPVIADSNIPEILPTGVCTYEHVVSNVPYESMVDRALEVRGCKVRITKVPIPVAYGPAFEGERIRKADMHAEFGGNRTSAFEFVSSVGLDEIDDGDIRIIGKDIDSIQPGDALPLGIWVEVAGRKMQTDFEPILERQIHHLVNGAEGILHIGQRDIVWCRISKDAFSRGVRLKDIGEIIHAKFLSEFPSIVDKVRVTLITEPDEVEERMKIAREVYIERNLRVEAMTDESVEEFYSCLLCQSFAPDHVCIITPERLGLCGAYNWLDGKAAHEIDNTGPNQPVKKGECLDQVKGVWQGVDEYVHTNSHRAIDSICLYSIMDRPMTSCGCFEVICAYVPECNGIMIVNREFQGNTPVGMTFSTLAGNVGGGMQTPGFMGCGKVFLTSGKFLFSDGGHKRIVWMPRELKELLGKALEKRAFEQGCPDLLDKIADETNAVEPLDVRKYLEQVNHPALEMADMGDLTGSVGEESDTRSKDDGQAGDRQHGEHGETAKGSNAIEKTAVDVSTRSIPQNNIEIEVRELVSREIESFTDREIGQYAIEKITSSILRKLGHDPHAISDGPAVDQAPIIVPVGSEPAPEVKPTAYQRLQNLHSFSIRKEKRDVPLWRVRLGATREEGGTRGHTLEVGGATCMPFHLWEGEMPNRPLVAMEVFDRVSEKYPVVLSSIYGDILHDPARMARQCVDKYGADLISVRLEGTHPEKGNRDAEQAVEVVKSVLKAVEVPIIVTGHNNYNKNNVVMKAVAQACQGENLLLNWVEQDNYRTIAGTALAYGHSVVSQSPIDVNIAKQLNILLTGMNVPRERIIIDPMTGTLGYGLEYTYSVMERIRLTALNGDTMLAGPMIVSPGQECARIKEFRATEDQFPAWGGLNTRTAMWELSTAVNLLYAGADILIMYHPDAVRATKRTIHQLMDGAPSGLNDGSGHYMIGGTGSELTRGAGAGLMNHTGSNLDNRTRSGSNKGKGGSTWH